MPLEELGTVIKGVWGRGGPFDLHPGDRYTLDGPRGIQTRRIRTRGDAQELQRLHLEGVQRLGLYAAKNGLCRWGCLDLDAHDAATPERVPEAVALVEELAGQGVLAYWTPSRHGRGAHVWLFFSGAVRQADLHAWLGALAQPYRGTGPVDVFPKTPSGSGGAVFLPHFGGEPLRDGDARPVLLDKLESNPAKVVPKSDRPAWPPPHWRGAWRGKASEKAETFREAVKQGELEGRVFPGRGGLPQARAGYRNRIAGGVAVSIARGGGAFPDFARWDQANVPPLASDEPDALKVWWGWAIRKKGA